MDRKSSAGPRRICPTPPFHERQQQYSQYVHSFISIRCSGALCWCWRCLIRNRGCCSLRCMSSTVLGFLLVYQKGASSLPSSRGVPLRLTGWLAGWRFSSSSLQSLLRPEPIYLFFQFIYLSNYCGLPHSSSPSAAAAVAAPSLTAPAWLAACLRAESAIGRSLRYPRADRLTRSSGG